MPSSMNEFTSLFRSIAPDDAAFQAANATAASEAAQRWPLFKALAPEKSNTTPALSDQDRACWVSQQKTGVSVRKPALSLPTETMDLALSLKRMTGTRHDSNSNSNSNSDSDSKPISAKVSTPIYSTPAQLPNRTAHATETEPSPPLPRQHANPIAAGTEDTSEKVSGSLFAGNGLRSHANRTTTSQPVTDTDSLRQLFNRLEGKSNLVVKPASKISSIFSRLGKR